MLKDTNRAMEWKGTIRGFKAYLLMERSLSRHSIEAYLDDVEKFQNFLEERHPDILPEKIDYPVLREFVEWLQPMKLEARSQARILSGLRAFFKYLLLENIITDDPTELLEGPRLPRKMPDVLSFREIEMIFAAIDMSDEAGQRNRAMLETLYACGLRVSELVNLRLSNIFFEDGFIKVLGKNNKERLVPIGAEALKQIALYMEGVRRPMMNIQRAHEDYVFLNRFGKKLSRVAVFQIVKDAVARAGIHKSVSPHTFRHSFATHLVAGGADLRAVQDMLGHESITTTEIYTHLDNKVLRETVLAFHPANKYRSGEGPGT